MGNPKLAYSNFEVKGLVDKEQKHCPKCGSPKLRWASGLPHLWSVYDCQECGYRGALVIEDGKLAEKIKARWLKRRG